MTLSFKFLFEGFFYASFLERIWIKQMARYQASARLHDILMSEFSHFIQVYWSKNASKSSGIANLQKINTFFKCRKKGGGH